MTLTIIRSDNGGMPSSESESQLTPPDSGRHISWGQAAEIWLTNPIESFAVLWSLVLFTIRCRAWNWWARPPFLPVIAPEYARWRFDTAYGKWTPDIPEFLYDMHVFGTWLTRLKAQTKMDAKK